MQFAEVSANQIKESFFSECGVVKSADHFNTDSFLRKRSTISRNRRYRWRTSRAAHDSKITAK
jgi:hypothetical protein